MIFSCADEPYVTRGRELSPKQTVPPVSGACLEPGSPSSLLHDEPCSVAPYPYRLHVWVEVKTLLEENGFAVTRVVERESVMRFANATALFNHHFIKLGFLDAWKDVVRDDAREAFGKLMEKLSGEIRLTIPMAYVEGVAI